MAVVVGRGGNFAITTYFCYICRRSWTTQTPGKGPDELKGTAKAWREAGGLAQVERARVETSDAVRAALGPVLPEEI